MDRIDGLIIIFFMLVIGIPALFMNSRSSGGLCKLIGHKTFVNQEFCTQTGALGKRTLRCSRCWDDVKELEIPQE